MKFGPEFKLIFPVLLALICCLLTTSPALAKIYRWVDENGQLHFSDSPQNIPEELRDQTKAFEPDPSGLTITPAGQQTENNPLPESEATEQTEASISIPYISKEQSADRVIINITFNGSVTVPILVDTGSPGLVISNSLASRLGLFDKDGNQLMVLISGIGGQQAAARTIVDTLSIGGVTEEFIPAHIVPEMSSAYLGLIGMDILSGYNLTIDSNNKQLIATKNPEKQNLPGGRSQSWWQANFREFGYYRQFWQDQEQLLRKYDSPYASLTVFELDRLRDFVEQQQQEAQELYERLERFARWRSVPRHWRR